MMAARRSRFVDEDVTMMAFLVMLIGPFVTTLVWMAASGEL